MSNEFSNYLDGSPNSTALQFQEKGDEGGGDPAVWSAFTSNFSQVQSLLDRNRHLIQQVNDNHRSRIHENLVNNVSLIQEINGNISKFSFRDLSMSKQTYKVCFCFRRRFRLAAAEAPADIKANFGDYSDNGVMSLDQFRRFLVEVRKEENSTLEDAQALADSLHEKHLNVFHHRKELNLEGFF